MTSQVLGTFVVSDDVLFAPRSTQPSIPPGLVNEYQLRLGRQRQVWLIPKSVKSLQNTCHNWALLRWWLVYGPLPLMIIPLYSTAILINGDTYWYNIGRMSYRQYWQTPVTQYWTNICAWAAQLMNHFHGVHYFKTMTFHSLVVGYVTAKHLNWSDSAWVTATLD